MTDTSVLIVGAGPTGLMLAIQLARAGLQPVVIDRHAGPAMQSRALGVHARTLEIYASWAWPMKPWRRAFRRPAATSGPRAGASPTCHWAVPAPASAAFHMCWSWARTPTNASWARTCVRWV